MLRDLCRYTSTLYHVPVPTINSKCRTNTEITDMLLFSIQLPRALSITGGFFPNYKASFAVCPWSCLGNWLSCDSYVEARDLARANTGGLFKGAVPLLTGSHRACKVLGSKSHRTVDRLHSVLTNEDNKKFTHQKNYAISFSYVGFVICFRKVGTSCAHISC